MNSKTMVDDSSKYQATVHKQVEGDKYYYFRDVDFKNETFKVGIPISHWVSIINSDDRIVAKLRTPRYTRDALAIELISSSSKSYLAILIEQQSTSHSSTLYILDSDFQPIYREHLLGAKWIAKKKETNGDVLLVSSEDFWFPNGHDTPNSRVNINGNWLYRLPQNKASLK